MSVTANKINNKRKSRVTEGKMKNILQGFVSNQQNKVYTNLLLRLKSGQACQIDGLVVSPEGVYVLEVKRIKGIITGNDTDESWTRIVKNGHKEINSAYLFPNPVKQLERSVDFLLQLFPEGTPIRKVLVFDDPRTLRCTSNSVKICTMKKLPVYMTKPRTPVLSAEEQAELKRLILSHRVTNAASNPKKALVRTYSRERDARI